MFFKNAFFKNTNERLNFINVYSRVTHLFLLDLAERDTIQHQLDDNGNGGLINKYLEVALLADEQVVATHGNKTEEFLLLIACVVSHTTTATMKSETPLEAPNSKFFSPLFTQSSTTLLGL